MSLKYLFQANFSDDTFIVQNQEDQSTLQEDKSTFYDVLQREDELIHFGLFSDEVSDQWTLDLRNGMFSHNGNPFSIQDPSAPQPEPNENRRLIYFRKVTRNFDASNMAELSVQYEFHIGFQYNDKDGKNHQVTLAVR